MRGFQETLGEGQRIYSQITPFISAAISSPQWRRLGIRLFMFVFMFGRSGDGPFINPPRRHSVDVVVVVVVVVVVIVCRCCCRCCCCCCCSVFKIELASSQKLLTQEAIIMPDPPDLLRRVGEKTGAGRTKHSINSESYLAARFRRLSQASTGLPPLNSQEVIPFPPKQINFKRSLGGRGSFSLLSDLNWYY